MKVTVARLERIWIEHRISDQAKVNVILAVGGWQITHSAPKINRRTLRSVGSVRQVIAEREVG